MLVNKKASCGPKFLPKDFHNYSVKGRLAIGILTTMSNSEYEFGVSKTQRSNVRQLPRKGQESHGAACVCIGYIRTHFSLLCNVQTGSEF